MPISLLTFSRPKWVRRRFLPALPHRRGYGNSKFLSNYGDIQPLWRKILVSFLASLALDAAPALGEDHVQILFWSRTVRVFA
jgi:hypothetical protein